MVEWEADRESGLAPSDALPLEMLYPLRTISSNQHHLLGTMYSNTGACEGHFTFISQPCSAATIMSFCVPSYTHTHTHTSPAAYRCCYVYTHVYILSINCVSWLFSLNSLFSFEYYYAVTHFINSIHSAQR